MTITAERPAVVLTPNFRQALAVYRRRSHWRERDAAFFRLQDAAELAGLELCHCCASGVPLDRADEATRQCCHEVVCDGCDEEHARTCAVHLSWSAEDVAAEANW